MESAQDLDGFGHRFRREKSGTEHAFAETRYLAVFVQARRRPACRRAIFSRTELEPTSTAAKVGIGSLTVYMRKGIASQDFAREPEAEVERNLGRSFCLADQHRALSVYFPRLRRGLRETDVGVRREFGDGMAEFTSGHVVQCGDEGRLIDLA